jgi:Rho termination factor-like protein
LTAYGILGDVPASPKLVRAALSDLLEAHQRVTPAGDFWLKVAVRNGELAVYDEILDWASRNGVYTEVVTPASAYVPYTEPAKLTVSPSFMLDVVETMRTEPDSKVLALVGAETPKTDVLRALAKAKDNGTEILDLAEAGLTLILFRGDDPPPDNPEEGNNMADEEYEATFAELGEYADDESDAETAEQAQKLLTDAAEEAGIDVNDYATWAEVAAALEEGGDAGDGGDEEDTEEETEEETAEEVTINGQTLTREDLVGKEIAEIKQLAKAAGIEGYSRMRREPLINALLSSGDGEQDDTAEESSPAPTPAKKAAAKKAAPTKQPSSAASNGDAVAGGGGISDADIERIADAVITKLGSALAS